MSKRGSKAWKKKISMGWKKALARGINYKHEDRVRAGKISASLKTPEQMKKFWRAGADSPRKNARYFLGKKLPESTKKKMSETHKKLYVDGKAEHLKNISVWSCGTKKQKENTRKKISDASQKRFDSGEGNLPIPYNEWREKIAVAWKVKIASGFKHDHLIKYHYKIGGKKIAKSDIQVKIYNWARKTYKGERVKINYPFEYNGRYAFGDIVFLDRKLVIEYDEPHWHQDEEADRGRDMRIINNGFAVERVNIVCYEQLVDIISTYPRR